MLGLISQLTEAANSRRPSDRAKDAERAYETWLREHYPDYFVDKAAQRPLPFAFYHDEFWSWVWRLKTGTRPKPLVAVWPRGTGKSTGAELSVVAAAARGARKYGLYVSGTQDLADKHVETIGAHLESPKLAQAYPLLAERSLGKYGNSRGWRRNRLRTTAGFYIDAVGLDVAVRGIKVERDRPDFIVLDDVDEESDDEAAVDRKVTAITRSILPAGASDVAVLFVQNVIHYESVCARLCGLAPAPEGRRREQFLIDRQVSGPHPALLDFEWEWDADSGRPTITRGAPTWPEGLDAKRCQQWVNDIGITSFRAEFQHENVASEGSPFAHVQFQNVAASQVPWDRITRVVCWCDPAVSDSDRSDANGVVVAGVTERAEMYVLFAWEKRSTPTETLKVAITAAREHGARTLGVETDQGGDTWQSVYYQAIQEMIAQGHLSPADWVPAFASAKAGASQMGKTARWQMMVPDYERSGQRRIYHVQGPHALLQRALLRVPAKKPYDLVDALWHAWNDLLNDAPVRFPLAQGIVRGGWSSGDHVRPVLPDGRYGAPLASGLYIPRV
jgi:hypothetical protein